MKILTKILSNMQIKQKRNHRGFPFHYIRTFLIPHGFMFLEQNLVNIPLIPHAGNRRKFFFSPNLLPTLSIFCEFDPFITQKYSFLLRNVKDLMKAKCSQHREPSRLILPVIWER